MTLRMTMVLVAALLPLGCASSIERAQPTAFELSISDNPSKRVFEVELKSKAERPLCLPVEAWPNEQGHFTTGYEAATLTTSAGLSQPRAAMTAYCPGGCGEIRVEPGKKVRGAIAYSAFGDATAIASDPTRKLSFQVFPYYCSR